MLRTGLVPVLEFIRPACAPIWGSENTPLKPKTEAAPASPSTIYPWAPGSHGIKRILWTHFLLGFCQDATHQGCWVSCLIAASPDPLTCPSAPTPAPSPGLAPLHGHSVPLQPLQEAWGRGEAAPPTGSLQACSQPKQVKDHTSGSPRGARVETWG